MEVYPIWRDDPDKVADEIEVLVAEYVRDDKEPIENPFLEVEIAKLDVAI